MVFYYLWQLWNLRRTGSKCLWKRKMGAVDGTVWLVAQLTYLNFTFRDGSER